MIAAGTRLRCIDAAYGLKKDEIYEVVQHEGSFVTVKGPDGRVIGKGGPGFDGKPTVALHRFTSPLRQERPS